MLSHELHVAKPEPELNFAGALYLQLVKLFRLPLLVAVFVRLPLPLLVAVLVSLPLLNLVLISCWWRCSSACRC
jgi:hypothetical protein